MNRSEPHCNGWKTGRDGGEVVELEKRLSARCGFDSRPPTMGGGILDAGFGMFRRMLEYKCAQTGARLHIVDRWYPSSKTCSNCGTVKIKLSLKERVYRCDHCGLVIDCDLNTAINIDVAGSAPRDVKRAWRARKTKESWLTPETLAASGEGNANQAAVPADCLRLGADAGNGVLSTRTN